MTKKLICLLLVVAFCVVLTGCNYKVVDLTYKFDEAIIELPGGEVISGKVDNWRDYEDGDQIQVQIDGTTYLVHSSDVVLINHN